MVAVENSHHHHNILLLREVVDIKANSGQCDYSLVAPIRQTASIFKQPVTVFKEHKSKVSLRILVNFVVLNDVMLLTQTQSWKMSNLLHGPISTNQILPREKRVNRNIFGTSNLQNRTYGVSCDE